MDRKLHIGGTTAHAEWEILNANNAPYVDHACNASDLSCFENDTFEAIYASHVVEHFDYIGPLGATLAEWLRVLKPGGKIYISVPNLDILANILLMKDFYSIDERYQAMRMIFGGHVDQYDYHGVGLNLEFLSHFLIEAGYTNIQKVDEFGIFDDTSSFKLKGVPISLNVIAEKPL